MCSGDLASCLSCRLVGHVDDQYDVSSVVYPDAFSPRYKNAVAAAGHRACCQHPQNHSQQSKNHNQWSRCQRNTCTKTSLSQEPPRALESSQRKRSVVTININPRAATAREIARCKSPQKKLESDELRDDVEMSRRRRLLVVSIDSSSSLLFKTHGATVPRKPPRNGVVSYYSLR